MRALRVLFLATGVSFALDPGKCALVDGEDAVVIVSFGRPDSNEQHVVCEAASASSRTGGGITE